MEELNGVSPAQIAFLKMLTDQRIANIVAAADLIGDMDSDTVAFLHTLSHKDKQHLRLFLTQSRPEVLKFLTDLREEDVDELNESIHTHQALKHSWRIVRYSVVTLFGTFVGMTLIWEKLVALFKGPK